MKPPRVPSSDLPVSRLLVALRLASRLVDFRAVSAAVVIGSLLSLALPLSLAASSAGPAVGSYPRAAAMPIATPEGDAVPDACASTVAPADWPVLVCETFDHNPNERWSVGILSDDYVISSRTVTDGKYRWQQKALKSFASVVKYEDANLTDFFVAVDARLVEGPQTAHFGVSFRQPGNSNEYTFDINDQGQYRLDVLVEGQWTTLIDWTDHPAIHSSGVNRVAAQGEGSQLTLYVNNQQVAEFADDRLAQGVVGITTDMDAGNQALFEFDNFEIRAPAGSEVVATPTTGRASPTPRATSTPRTAMTPTATPTRRATSTPRTPRRTPTATPTPSDLRSLLGCDADLDVAPLDWLPTVCDTFDAKGTQWTVGADNSDFAKMNRSILSGVYRWKIDGLQSGVFSAWYGSDRFSDVFVAVDVRRVSGPTAMGYGLNFRKPDSDNFYDFKISDDGDYKIQVLINNEWTVLTDWAASDAIHRGAWNRLAVQADGSTLTFWINGRQVAQHTDDHLTDGEVGLEASLYDPVQATVEFDNFSVWTP